MGTVNGRPLPESVGADMAALRASIQGVKDVAREWLSEGLDPCDPLAKGFLAPVLASWLAADGKLAAFREAGIDPWDALCAAADAVEAEDPA